LYAPSWGHTYNYGDILSRNFENVMQCLLTKDIIILVKLHAASFIKGQSQGICWRQRAEKYRHFENVRIIDELNDIPFFKIADILISDISSRSFNFMLLGRPVIIYGLPDDYTLTGIEKLRMAKILEAASLANTPVDLSRVVDACLQTPDAFTHVSKQVAKDVFANPGCATAETVRKILEHLDIVL
jgi:CDP-glycerol glycerophosphotransferase (TagB/SpsB family)